MEVLRPEGQQVGVAATAPPQMPQSLPVQPLYPPMPPSMYPDVLPPVYDVARNIKQESVG